MGDGRTRPLDGGWGSDARMTHVGERGVCRNRPARALGTIEISMHGNSPCKSSSRFTASRNRFRLKKSSASSRSFDELPSRFLPISLRGIPDSGQPSFADLSRSPAVQSPRLKHRLPFRWPSTLSLATQSRRSRWISAGCAKCCSDSIGVCRHSDGRRATRRPSPVAHRLPRHLCVPLIHLS
jgi:hypothetical protein